MTKIDPSLYLNNQPTKGTTNASLGKDDFLRILMAQLQNQSPANPMKDKEFISQMTSFSSLEQMMNMSSSIEQLVQSQYTSPILKYSNLIGKEVSYQEYDEETGEPLETITSTVVSVSQYEGLGVLELANEKEIYAEAITKVSEPSTE